MSIANYLTLTRLLISPIFLALYVGHEMLMISFSLLPYILILLITISELSDACDGYLARRYNQVTDFGKILDPMADSIYRISLFLTFTLPPVQLPMILIFIFLYRDFVISTLRTICALMGFALAARPSGKFKAVIQAIAAFSVVLLLIPYSQGHLTLSSLHLTSSLIVCIAALYTLFSGVDYIYANRHFISKAMGLQEGYRHSSSTLISQVD